MEQLLEVMQALGVVVEELEGDADGVAGMQLAQVAHMHLGGVDGMGAARHVVGADPDQLVGLVHRAVEQYVIIGHVEMAVIIDPLRLDSHHG
jgi:hypothetical protein